MWKIRDISGLKRYNKIWQRGTVITKEYVGKAMDIHCGNGFVNLYVTEDMLGYRFGEFALTRKFTQKWEKNWRVTASVIRKKKKGKSTVIVQKKV